jgi:hypothetical protein
MNPVVGAIDTALSGCVSDIAAFWITVAAVVTTVVVFGIGIAYVKKLRRT